LIGSWKTWYMCESIGESAKIVDTDIANK